MNQLGKGVAGVLLAAGSSTRMQRPKQLLPVGEETLLGRSLREALNSDLDIVVLVLGYKAREIKRQLGPLLNHPKVKATENRNYKNGLGSSIIKGLSEIEGSHDHVMILLADMPHMDSNLINLLLQKYLDSHLPIGAIKVKNKRSHPVVFSRELYPELRGLRGDVGARALFEKYDHKVCLVEPESAYDDRDIDTPDDYAQLQRSLKNK
ncbi:MAG: nucleotidyltransferase family protein [Desulfobacteraceae bacterium]|nr:nucleotidyltransferase family protein [Desulfobacteraceae bacterium]